MSYLWQYSNIYKCMCKIIEEQTLWGQTVCIIWLPNQNLVARVPKSTLRTLSTNIQPSIESHHIKYIAAATKVAEVLEGVPNTSDGHVLLAPMESNVIPLPHQIHTLNRAISGNRIRYLLADEVGLGKTIEAGLIMRELKLRGLVRRTLVVAPKGLTSQWVSEMQTHFNESFHLILGDDIGTLKRLVPVQSRDNSDSRRGTLKSGPWTFFDQVVVSLDSVKPIDKRRGWPEERVAEYNRSRFEDLLTAKWDLVVIDEAHRLGGSSDHVARHKLGLGLAEAAPYVLLLSATPHQGKTDAFHRLLNLLDSEAFPDMDSVTRDQVAPFVIRTEKRNAMDTDGKPLFKPRYTRLVPIKWEARHHLQLLLYEAVTDYVREGYNQAIREKKRHIGFLMVLMQRLVVSSTKAIRTTLERRLEVLKAGVRQAGPRLEEIENRTELIEDLYDLNGQELLDELMNSQVTALQNEVNHVETLLNAARNCEQAGPDAKAEALIEWIYQLQSDENEPDLKVLIFTEFVPTQQMLKEFLEARGISVVTINGSMDMDQRKQAQNDFRSQTRVLVSTDAGGEGLNLQFCHIVINYDIPWNPMRLEQRIGRVDRIGQPKTVKAINFLFEESVEFRIREVLEEKLSIIFREFGIDKTGDVLDSAQAGELFEDIYVSAILNPEAIESLVDQMVSRIHEEIRMVRESSAFYSVPDDPDLQSVERLRSHPMPHWIERMTVSYLNSHGGKATRKRSWWELNWPDGQAYRKCVFSVREADRLSDALLINLENSRVRALVDNFSQIVAEQLVPHVALNALPSEITGFWGLFEIRLQAGEDQQNQFIRIPPLRRAYLSVFINEDGQVYLPTARHIWDLLLTTEPIVLGYLETVESYDTYNRLLHAAEMMGKELFHALRQEHFASISREEERGLLVFESRRKAIERVGLSEVRQYRMVRCEAEEAEWRRELESAKQTLPEIRSLLLMRIVKGDSDEKLER